MREKLKQWEEKPIEAVVLRLLGAWCFSSVLFFFLGDLDAGDLSAYSRFPLWLILLCIAGAYALLWAASQWTKRRVEIYALPAVFLLFSVCTALSLGEWYPVFLLTALWATLIFYYQRQGYLIPAKPLSKRGAIAAVCGAAAFFVLTVGGIGVLRVLSFRAPNYDFGIFCQAFYNMKTRFLPLTTCERDRLLSHFAVHISPILYLLLPVYAVFSTPITLQICQTLILASAAVPLLLLGKRFGLSAGRRALPAALLLLHPAVAAGTNYDFHENCFLLPLLLWTFYFFETKKYLPMAVFSLLTLCVKEDAAVYLVFFALFVALDRKKYGVSAALAAGAAVWFAGALFLLSRYGDGVMVGRYKNFIVDDGGLAEAVRNLLADPGYAFTQLLANKDGDAGDKLLFLFQILVPTAFLPFCVKKVSRLTLLFPMLLINLLTTYAYQFDIGFQYVFGPLAFLFYLSLLNLKDLDDTAAFRFLSVSLAACALCVFVNVAPRLTEYGSAYFGNRETTKAIEETLAEVPDDATVICSTFFLPRLSQRDEIYEVSYHTPAKDESVDYVILDGRYNYAAFVKKYETLGYRLEKTVSVKGREILFVLRGGDGE